MQALEFIDVSKHFYNKPALNSVSFQINIGEMISVIGPIASGKTTILSLATGLLQPDSGSIRVFGTSMTLRPNSILQRINFASSSSRLSGYATVLENYLTFCRLYNIQNPLKKIQQISALLNISHLVNGKVKTFRLSAGENSLVNLGKSLLNNPDLLLLDEITAHLDPITSTKIVAILRKINNKSKTTIVFSTHQIEDAQKLSNHFIILKHGTLIHNGRLTNVAKLKSWYK